MDRKLLKIFVTNGEEDDKLPIPYMCTSYPSEVMTSFLLAQFCAIARILKNSLDRITNLASELRISS